MDGWKLEHAQAREELLKSRTDWDMSCQKRVKHSRLAINVSRILLDNLDARKQRFLITLR